MRTITEEDVKFDKLTDAYLERFHDNYGINFGDSRPLAYHIGVMEEALRTGVPVEIEDDYPDPNIVV